jgi:hypothetical protein
MQSQNKNIMTAHRSEFFQSQQTPHFLRKYTPQGFLPPNPIKKKKLSCSIGALIERRREKICDLWSQRRWWSCLSVVGGTDLMGRQPKFAGAT